MAYQGTGEIETAFSTRASNGSVHNQTVEERQLQRTDSEGNEEETGGGVQDSKGHGTNKKLRLFLRAVIGGVLFLVVLACVVFSKLTLISLANELRDLRSRVTANTTENKTSVSEVSFCLCYSR